MVTQFKSIAAWIVNDYRAYPLRCVLEISAWAMSIVCAGTMALTIPNAPFIILYPMFILQCSIFAWAAWTRKSSGMLGNYILLVTIDTIALIRLMLGLNL
jgi:hypothetical protein